MTGNSEKRGRTGPPSKGLVKAMFSIEPAQLAALRREATRRAEQDPDVQTGRKSLRAAVDASALVRAALAAWLGKHTSPAVEVLNKPPSARRSSR